MPEQDINILLSRTDRCVSCLTRWVNNNNLTLNAACLLLVKVACEMNNNSSVESEEILVSLINEHIKKYVHEIYQHRRTIMSAEITSERKDK